MDCYWDASQNEHLWSHLPCCLPEPSQSLENSPIPHATVSLEELHAQAHPAHKHSRGVLSKRVGITWQEVRCLPPPPTINMKHPSKAKSKERKYPKRPHELSWWFLRWKAVEDTIYQNWIYLVMFLWRSLVSVRKRTLRSSPGSRKLCWAPSLGINSSSPVLAGCRAALPGSSLLARE